MEKLRLLLIIMTSVLVITLSGCWSARDLNALSIVTGMGFDKTAAPDEVLLTAQIVKAGELHISSPEGGKGNGKAYWNVTNTGETISSAIHEITHKIDKPPFFAHTAVVVYGSDLAAAGVQKSLDFLLRNNQMRPTALVAVASGTAADILTVESESEALPALNISKTIKSYEETSQFKAVTIADFANRLMSKTASPVAPLVSTVVNGNTKSIYISGLAVFKKDKMTGTLNQLETRGLLWVTGEVKKGLILINAPDGQGKVVLKISSATSKVTPEVKDGKLTMHIKILTEGTLAEQTSPENLATVSAIAWLQERQAEAIRQEIMAAFTKSRELQADIFGFGDMVYQKLPDQWEELAENWDEVYPAIELMIDVETKIRGTNVLTKPATQENRVTNERLFNEH